MGLLIVFGMLATGLVSIVIFAGPGIAESMLGGRNIYHPITGEEAVHHKRLHLTVEEFSSPIINAVLEQYGTQDGETAKKFAGKSSFRSIMPTHNYKALWIADWNAEREEYTTVTHDFGAFQNGALYVANSWSQGAINQNLDKHIQPRRTK